MIGQTVFRIVAIDWASTAIARQIRRQINALTGYVPRRER